MDNIDTHNIQTLLKQAVSDKNAAVELLKIYRNDMLKEAAVYIKDEKAAKDAVIQAFKNAYKKIEDTEAEQLGEWLNQYVKEECIRASLPLKKAESHTYSDIDEIPAERVKMPETAKTQNLLKSVLNRLNSSERLVSVLRFRDQYSFQEIAEKCKISEDEVRYLLTDAKKAITDAKGNLAVIFAMVNHLYPYYKKENVIEETPSYSVISGRAVTEEEEFNTELRELREFFDTKTVPVGRISDHSIDDIEDLDSDDNEQTFEMKAIRQMSDSNVNDTASSAKMIMAAAMEAEPDDDIPEKEYDPRGYWFKRIITIVLFAILAVVIGVAVAIIRSKDADKPETAKETETVTPEVTAEPTPTPEVTEEPVADDGTIGTAYILVTDLTMRKGPGVNYEQNGTAEPEATYTVYEMVEADGYTWYRVADEQWVPDLQGQFVNYTAK